MTIRTAVEALQAINANITGVASAPVVYPGSLNTASLPLVIVWPGPAEVALEGFGFNMTQRIYRVTCYVKASQQGRGIDEGWQQVITLLQRFHTAYLDSTKNPIVNDDTYKASIRNSTETPITDTGLELFAYPPPATGIEGIPHYYGFEMLVPVKENWSGS